MAKGKRDVEKMFNNLSFQDRVEVAESIMTEKVLKEMLGEDASYLEKQLQDLKESTPSNQAFEWNGWMYDTMAEGYKTIANNLRYYKFRDLMWRLKSITDLLENGLNLHRDYVFNIFAKKKIKLKPKSHLLLSPSVYEQIMRNLGEKDELFKNTKEASKYNIYSTYGVLIISEVQDAETIALPLKEKKKVMAIHKKIEELEDAVEEAEDTRDNEKAGKLCDEINTLSNEELVYLPIIKQFQELMEMIDDIREKLEEKIEVEVKDYNKELHEKLYQPDPILLKYDIKRPKLTTEKILEECIKHTEQQLNDELDEQMKMFVKYHPDLTRTAFGEEYVKSVTAKKSDGDLGTTTSN